jgi:hypothetical protein
VAAAVLAVTAMLAAMWAGPLAAASVGTQPRAGFSAPAPAPAPVKFYIVPPPENGPAESLFTIAAKTLGDGSRFMEIFNLNRGRLQPNGGRLTKPQLIEPGWILQLPTDAAGPGVRFGPLPVVTAPTSHRPSRSTGTGSVIMISEALAFLTAGLAFMLIRRRASRTRRADSKPETTPAAKPETRPARKPEGRPRQLVAVHVAAAATAALVLFALIAGSTEVALHGFQFFVFRSVGTGETGRNGLEEDQGPGQADAPKPTPSHIKVQPSPHSTATVRSDR